MLLELEDEKNAEALTPCKIIFFNEQKPIWNGFCTLWNDNCQLLLHHIEYVMNGAVAVDC